MTKREILNRMEAGEQLRWISREVSGKKVAKKYELGFRDLFLGRQELTEEDYYVVAEMERRGEIVAECDKYNKKPVIHYSLS